MITGIETMMGLLEFEQPHNACGLLLEDLTERVGQLEKLEANVCSDG